MGLLDQWAERHILDAQDKGEFDNLPGQGQPLTLEDRKEALTVARLLQGISSEHPDYVELSKRMALLEHRLRQAGMSTDFLHGEYQRALDGKFTREEK